MQSKFLTTVWRVENELGCGPYRDRDLGGVRLELEEMGFNREDDSRHPGPFADPDIAPRFSKMSEAERKKWVFGFRTLASFNEWFDNEAACTLLTKNNFFLTRYNVPEENVIGGKTQVLFYRRGCLVVGFNECSGIPIKALRPEELPPSIQRLLHLKRHVFSCQLSR